MDLPHHFLARALDNRRANYRLLYACAQLDPLAFTERRAGAFPSLRAMLNRLLAVERHYLDAMERACQGRAPNERWRGFFDPAEPCGTCTELAAALADCDARLITLCRHLDASQLRLPVTVPRERGPRAERLDRLLVQLFRHQDEQRGRVHAMLAGHAVPRPPPDEPFCDGGAAWREGAAKAPGSGADEAPSASGDGPGQDLQRAH